MMSPVLVFWCNGISGDESSGCCAVSNHRSLAKPSPPCHSTKAVEILLRPVAELGSVRYGPLSFRRHQLGRQMFELRAQHRDHFA